MKILIIGFGKMGKHIEELALLNKHEIAGIVDIGSSVTQFAGKADVAFEFTTPDSAVENILSCFQIGLPVVCGTTGWYENLENVKRKADELNGTLIYSSNFSIGVNIFFLVNSYLAQLMNKFPQYTPMLKEVHHTKKIDIPSGTAMTLANDIVENIERLDTWKLNTNRVEKNLLSVTAERIEDVKGMHTCWYESSDDTITISHEALTRRGFAQGAFLAAEFIQQRKGVICFKSVFIEITKIFKI